MDDSRAKRRQTFRDCQQAIVLIVYTTLDRYVLYGGLGLHHFLFPTANTEFSFVSRTGQ